MEENIVIHVNVSKPYDVIVGKGLLKKAGEIVKEISQAKTVAIVSDDKVYSLYGKTVEESLKTSGFSVCAFVFPFGEKSKSFDTYKNAVTFLADKRLSRKDAVLALGGGVTGDLAGFVSATYLRGIDYFQFPTTLLSMIDSSVGGKTAIDLKEGKNLLGAFYQPKKVVIDVNALSTLPDDVYKEGMGEAVKYAFLDKNIFDLMQEEYSDEELIALCVKYKAKIVEEDEFESGNRKLLNLGHTVAHGIEKLSWYKIPHGKAVALGLKSCVTGAFSRGVISKDYGIGLLEFIEKHSPCGKLPYSLSDILSESVYDKKRNGNTIDIACFNAVGNVSVKRIELKDVGDYFGESAFL